MTWILAGCASIVLGLATAFAFVPLWRFGVAEGAADRRGARILRALPGCIVAILGVAAVCCMVMEFVTSKQPSLSFVLLMTVTLAAPPAAFGVAATTLASVFLLWLFNIIEGVTANDRARILGGCAIISCAIIIFIAAALAGVVAPMRLIALFVLVAIGAVMALLLFWLFGVTKDAKADHGARIQSILLSWGTASLILATVPFTLGLPFLLSVGGLGGAFSPTTGIDLIDQSPLHSIFSLYVPLVILWLLLWGVGRLTRSRPDNG